jgi:hypothetical protein
MIVSVSTRSKADSGAITSHYHNTPHSNSRERQLTAGRATGTGQGRTGTATTGTANDSQ